MAPERGVTGIAAGRRETIGEAGVGWRRRTESWSMTGLLCRVCNRIPALHNFSLAFALPAVYRAFPRLLHSILLDRSTVKQRSPVRGPTGALIANACERSAKGVKGPARQNQEA